MNHMLNLKLLSRRTCRFFYVTMTTVIAVLPVS